MFWNSKHANFAQSLQLDNFETEAEAKMKSKQCTETKIELIICILANTICLRHTLHFHFSLSQGEKQTKFPCIPGKHILLILTLIRKNFNVLIFNCAKLNFSRWKLF